MAAQLTRAARLAALPPYVLAVWDNLQSQGETYLVGGALRDILMGRAPRDYDLATSLVPQEAQQLLGWSEGPGGRFGSLRGPGMPLEVVSLREETGYRDRRRPDAVQFGASLQHDLSRRDFTVNAIAMRRDGRIIDPHGGRKDLMRRRLAAVGDPEERLREDLLRVLRAYRLSAQLEFRLSTALRAAARCTARELHEVAPERLGDEIWRLISSPMALKALRQAQRDGVLGAVAPWLHPTHPADGTLVRLLAWTGPAPPETVLTAAQRFAWPHAARRRLAKALLLRRAVRATPERARWRAALAESGADAALLLVQAGGDQRLQALARLYGREGIIDRTRLPLRGLALARVYGAEEREIGRLERQELEKAWKDPRSLI